MFTCTNKRTEHFKKTNHNWDINPCKCSVYRKILNKMQFLEGLSFSILSLSVPPLPLLTWHKCLLDTRLCVSGVVVHQFVGSALFAAGNLHHHFNQQGSASSPKHSATIGKPCVWQHDRAQAAQAAGRIHGLTATLSVCLAVGMTACCPALLKQICHSQHRNVATYLFCVLQTPTCVCSETHSCVESDPSLIRVLSWKLSGLPSA